MPLRIDFQDILRATLPVRSGNEGWIGVSPLGDEYHVVVPVDVQIARGVMAGNLPRDGTPFGGYTGWLYFRCPPYEDAGPDEEASKRAQAKRTAHDLVKLLATYRIESTWGSWDAYSEEVSGTSCNAGGTKPPLTSPVNGPDNADAGRTGGDERDWVRARVRYSGCSPVIECGNCGNTWPTLGRFLKDPELRLERYEACTHSFRDGVYVFSHGCGGEIRLPVSRFARPGSRLRSLIGTHACPGLCYYDSSRRACEASCEGAVYRRIALALSPRTRDH